MLDFSSIAKVEEMKCLDDLVPEFMSVTWTSHVDFVKRESVSERVRTALSSEARRDFFPIETMNCLDDLVSRWCGWVYVDYMNVACWFHKQGIYVGEVKQHLVKQFKTSPLRRRWIAWMMNGFTNGNLCRGRRIALWSNAGLLSEEKNCLDELVSEFMSVTGTAIFVEETEQHFEATDGSAFSTRGEWWTVWVYADYVNINLCRGDHEQQFETAPAISIWEIPAWSSWYLSLRRLHERESVWKRLNSILKTASTFSIWGERLSLWCIDLSLGGLSLWVYISESRWTVSLGV